MRSHEDWTKSIGLGPSLFLFFRTIPWPGVFWFVTKGFCLFMSILNVQFRLCSMQYCSTSHPVATSKTLQKTLRVNGVNVFESAAFDPRHMACGFHRRPKTNHLLPPSSTCFNHVHCSFAHQIYRRASMYAIKHGPSKPPPK